MRSTTFALVFALWYATSCLCTSSTKVILKNRVLEDKVVLLWLQLFASVISILGLHFVGVIPKLRARLNFRQLRHIIRICIVYTGGFFCLQSGLSYCSVSLSVTTRALEPVVTCIFGALFLRDESISKTMWLSLAPIVIGVSSSAMSDMTFNVRGFAFLFLADIFFSLRSLAVKKMRKDLADKSTMLNGTETYFAVCWTGLLLLTFLFMCKETLNLLLPAPHGEDVDVKSSSIENVRQAFSSSVGILLVNTMTFAAYNCSSYTLLGSISMASHAVLNAMRQAVVVAFSAWYFARSFTMLNMLGVFLSFVGVALFKRASRVKPKGTLL